MSGAPRSSYYESSQVNRASVDRADDKATQEQVRRPSKVGGRQPIPKNVTHLVLMQPGSILKTLFRASFWTIPSASLSNKRTAADAAASGLKKHLSNSTMADAEPQPPPAAAPPAEEAPAAEEQLPKLSASEFRLYNHMAEQMDYYVRPTRSSPHPPQGPLPN
ncbi:hypothetical protein AOQ84DRAFT_220618 [Glonium stellatum]|uniref:Uncharacterized protein n=1 Tax=Glonium stellatum TaxID=574774 RepID=A0A8E2EMD5_9PEZI|nr:hypothetical protein AOQ84DRAFT_220618 [Glonium stellatum]